MSDLVLWIATAVLALTTTGLLISRSWRLSIAMLALQYFATFWLLLAHWPLNMSATVLVTGWMAAAALGMTRVNIKEDPNADTSWPQGSLFRIFAAALVLLAISAIISSLTNSRTEPTGLTGIISWLPNLQLPLAWGALILIGLGLLQLGMTLQPLRVILGLLTTLMGFEVLYTVIESSILVAGFLSIITIGLALTGCYLLILGEQPV